MPAVADAFVAAGVRFLQVRAKQLPGRAFLAVCEAVVQTARPAGAMVIVNDRVDIARFARADGVHVGQDDLQPGMVRQILGGDAVVGLSTHSIEQVRAALRLPVDYIAIGPVFGTSSKDTGYEAVGLELVREARALLLNEGAQIAIVAIGGITLERARGVIEAGASSVAVISDLLSTGDPAARASQYLRALE